MLNEGIEYWITSSKLPENININGANIAVNFSFNERGTLVCSLSSGKLTLEKFIQQKAS